VSPASNPATFAARARASVDEGEMLPTHGSLIASGTKLPELRLDIHVYSAKPAERFVFVNMRKYVEGQSLSEGPVLERITSDGAILNQQGTRFLLPRQ
jgi:general secretion pathway protein B